MQLTTAIRNLTRNDAKLIGRDSFLLAMLAYAIGLAIVLRLAVPWLNDNLEIPFDLAALYPMLVAFLGVFLGSMFAGLIIGFVLLDEKDDHTLKAMLVTPLPITTYIVYRVGVPMILAFFIIVAQVLIMDLPGTLPAAGPLLLIALGAALTAPTTSLFFATFAENKVQGFALAKFTGIAGMLIAGSWFVPEPLQWLFGLFPPWWASKAYWLALDGSNLWIVALLFGIVLQAGLIWLLVRRFRQIVYT